MEAFLLKKLEEEPEVFDQNYLVAISFDDMGNHTIVTALFNNQACHSMAQVLALVDNVLFKLLSGPRASLTLLNHPQPRSSMETAEDILYEYVQLSFLLAERLPLLPASSLFVSLFYLQIVILKYGCFDQFYLNDCLSLYILPLTGVLKDIILSSTCFLEWLSFRVPFPS